MSTMATTEKQTTNILGTALFKTVFVLFLLVYFIYLVLSKTPASIAAWAVHKASPNVWLMNVEGTLWNGTARGAQVDMGSQSIPLGTVRWTMNPLTLLTMKPCVNVNSQMTSGTFCQSLAGSTQIENLTFDAPLSIAKDFIHIEAAGQISLQVVKASLSDKRINELDAKITWQNARINPLDTWVSLDTIAAQISGNENGGINAKIFDISSPLKIDLNATWAPGDTNWKIAGTTTVLDTTPEIIKQGLQSFAEGVSPNTFKLQWP